MLARGGDSMARRRRRSGPDPLDALAVIFLLAAVRARNAVVITNSDFTPATDKLAKAAVNDC